MIELDEEPATLGAGCPRRNMVKKGGEGVGVDVVAVAVKDD